MNKLTNTQDNNIVSSNAPDNNLLQFLKTKFTQTEQQLFVQSFSMYLKYDDEKEFVIDLDTVWEWMGFSKQQRIC